MKILSNKPVVTAIAALIVVSVSLVGVGFLTGLFGSTEKETHTYEGLNLCEIKDNNEYNEIVDSRWSEINRGNSEISTREFTNRYRLIFEAQSCTSYENIISYNTSLLTELSTRINAESVDSETADFVTSFYNDLDVFGLINLWGLSSSYAIEEGLDDEDLDSLQSSISELLAFSSNSENPNVNDSNERFYLDAEYIADFIDLGSEKISIIRFKGASFSGPYVEPEYEWYEIDPEWEIESVGPTVYGWSVLAPLLREGEFHEDFLTPVATAAIQFDQEQDGDWRIDGEGDLSFDMFDDDVASSIDAVLEALSKNEVAAEEVYEATGDERVKELIG